VVRIINNLDAIIEDFEEYIESEESNWSESRQDKDQFLRENFFDRDALTELDEGVISQLLHKLWAYQFWSSKDYILDDMLESGIDTIRREFDTLFFNNLSSSTA